MAAKAGCTPDELVQRFNLNIAANDGDGVAVSAELLPAPPGKRGMKMRLPTIGIVVALVEEFDAVRLMISNERRHRADGPGGSREYLLGEIPSTRKGAHQVVVAQTATMGNNSAALRASKLLTDFDGIDAIIMCGIAGGVPHPTSPQDHVRLGDIVVSNRMGVVQYDLGKQKLKDFEHRNPPNPPSPRLLEAVQLLEQDRLAGKRPWEDHLRVGMAARSISIPDPSTDVVLDKDGESVEHPMTAGPTPRVFLGPIASANIVQGDFRKRDQLRDRFKVKAVEMEGSGIADATWEYEKAGYLVVRGACDYCDSRTKHFQTDAWKPYAAMAAAAYVRALLEVIPGEITPNPS
jgi:nucleoside phosphorylase